MVSEKWSNSMVPLHAVPRDQQQYSAKIIFGKMSRVCVIPAT